MRVAVCVLDEAEEVCSNRVQLEMMKSILRLVRETGTHESTSPVESPGSFGSQRTIQNGIYIWIAHYRRLRGYLLKFISNTLEHARGTLDGGRRVRPVVLLQNGSGRFYQDNFSPIID